MPHDFGRGRFRLVSTRNGIPTQDDIENVIRRGMPGTSMRAFEELSHAQHALLAGEVLRYWREGIRQELLSLATFEEEEIDEDSIQRHVERRTAPGEVVSAPDLGAATSESVERGRTVYFKQSCHSCHGADGSGSWELRLFDDFHRPTRARDLVREPFKGGQDTQSIYRRIVLGMPGTPHPSSPSLAEKELADLVHYCRSLSKGPKLILTNHQRRTRATSRSYLRGLGHTPKNDPTAPADS